MAEAMAAEPEADFKARPGLDWAEVARLVLTSRAMDELEETRLVPEKKGLYQFSARGHDMAQVILGMHLRDGGAACGYYRSRPGRCCWRWACRWPTRWVRGWAWRAVIATAATSAWCSTTPIRAAPMPCL